MNTLIAIQSAEILVTLAINSMLGIQKYQAAIANARAEERDITDAELQELQDANRALTDEVVGLLRG